MSYSSRKAIEPLPEQMFSSLRRSTQNKCLLLSRLIPDLLYLVLQCLDRESRLRFMRLCHSTKDIASHPLGWIKDKNVIDTFSGFWNVDRLAASVCRWAPTHIDLRGRMEFMEKHACNELLNLPSIRSIRIDAQNMFYLTELFEHSKCSKVCYCRVRSDE